MVNSTCVISPWPFILTHSARRLPTSSITAPTDLGGASITRYSIGSMSWPSISLVMTRGLPTDSS